MSIKRLEFGFGIGKTVAITKNVNNDTSFMVMLIFVQLPGKTLALLFVTLTAENYNKRMNQP